jgi:hypothetical protein
VCHICRTVDPFRERVPNCRTVDVFSSERLAGYCLVSSNLGENAVMKIVIVAGATLALVTAAVAADLPRRQPVYQEAPVGKMPIGKSPIGKTPVGQPPVGSRY